MRKVVKMLLVSSFAAFILFVSSTQVSADPNYGDIKPQSIIVDL